MRILLTWIFKFKKIIPGCVLLRDIWILVLVLRSIYLALVLLPSLYFLLKMLHDPAEPVSSFLIKRFDAIKEVFMRRFKPNRRGDKRRFSKTASKSSMRNMRAILPTRGGYRL